MKLLGKSEMLELAATIYDELINGHSDADIMDMLGLSIETYREAKKFMLEDRATDARSKSPDQSFVEYTIQQRQNIKELTNLLEGLSKEKQPNVIVAAIRLRADIVERMVTRAQEFGFVKKVPERRELVGGVALFDMSSPDLRKAIVVQIEMLKDMVSKFGDKDFSELAPGTIHYGETFVAEGAEVLKKKPLELPKASGKARAKTSRRAGGRKRSFEKD